MKHQLEHLAADVMHNHEYSPISMGKVKPHNHTQDFTVRVNEVGMQGEPASLTIEI